METEKTRRRPRFLIAILALSVVAAVVVKISRDAGAFGSDSNLKANIKKVEKLRDVVARRILVYNEPFDSRDGEFVKLATDLAKIRRQPEACGIDQTRLDLATQILGGEIDAQTKTGAATLDKFLADYQYCAQNAEFLLDLCYHYNDMNDKIRAANSAAERAKIKAELGEDYQAALDLLGAYADVCNELDAGDLRPKTASENGAIGKIFAKIPTPELETRAPKLFDAPQKTVKWSDRLKFWRNQETDAVENELRDALFKGNGAYVEEAVAAIRDDVKKEDGKKFWRMAATSLSAVAALILFGFCFAVYAIFRAFDGKKEFPAAPAPR